MIEPRFDKDGIQLYCADCLDVMPQLEAGSIDLTVTSPPYGKMRTYNGHVDKFRFEPIAQELYRVTKPGGVVVWVVGDETVNGSESGDSYKQALYFMGLGFNLHDTMIYMKSGPSYPSQDKYYQVFEFMFILSRGKPNVFIPIKDRENRWWGEKWSKIRSRRKKDGSLVIQSWYKEEGERFGTRFNIWQYTVGNGYNAEEDYAYDHPAIFPEALAYDHILSWSNPGGVILDPMMGSGTTGKMAYKLERQFIGIEVSEEYYPISEKRIRDAMLQIRMPI